MQDPTGSRALIAGGGIGELATGSSTSIGGQG
jgi:hypothetical protein